MEYKNEKHYIIDVETNKLITSIKELVDGRKYRFRLPIKELIYHAEDGKGTDKLIVKLSYEHFTLADEVQFITTYTHAKTEALSKITDICYEGKLRIIMDANGCVRTRYVFEQTV